MSEGRVGDLYADLKEMAVNFGIRPGERINEVALARELNVSRTPLREALNRLLAERLIDFQPGRGFFCRELDPRSIFELYELRTIVETAAVQLACERASDAGIAALQEGPFSDGMAYAGRTVREVTSLDEAFHIAVAELSGNRELVRQLKRINEQIRFIRWVDMAARARKTKGEHRAIMTAIAKRDTKEAEATMRTHITKRMDQIVEVVRQGYSSIYVPGADEPFERGIEGDDG